jgi:hypothetical protein
MAWSRNACSRKVPRGGRTILYQIDPAPFQAAYESARRRWPRLWPICLRQIESDRIKTAGGQGGQSHAMMTRRRLSTGPGRNREFKRLRSGSYQFGIYRVTAPISGRIGQIRSRRAWCRPISHRVGHHSAARSHFRGCNSIFQRILP